MAKSYRPEGTGPAEMTEISLGLGLILAIGVLLGSLALRHADLVRPHSALFASLTHVTSA